MQLVNPLVPSPANHDNFYSLEASLPSRDIPMEVRREGDSAIIGFKGAGIKLDNSNSIAPEVVKAVSDTVQGLNQKPKVVILSLDNVEFISNTAFAALLELHFAANRAPSPDGQPSLPKIVLADLKGQPSEKIKSLGLDTFLTIYPNSSAPGTLTA